MAMMRPLYGWFLFVELLANIVIIATLDDLSHCDLSRCDYSSFGWSEPLWSMPLRSEPLWLWSTLWSELLWLKQHFMRLATIEIISKSWWDQMLELISIVHQAFQLKELLIFLLISLGVVAEMVIKTIPWVPSFTTTRRRSARPAPSTSCFLNLSNCDQFV